MSLTATAFLALLTLARPASAVRQTTQAGAPSKSGSCIACHEALPDARLSDPAKHFPQDIHAVKGFGCADCHGGDASLADFAAMDPAKGFVGKPSRQQVPQLCGRCHSNAEFMKRYNPALRVDQVLEYSSSVHGQRLARLNDPKVATCINCHPAHAIRPPSDPLSSVYPLNVSKTCGACHAKPDYMASYGIPTDQLAKYQTSVHWQAMSVRHDLTAPTCNDCHGNHGATPPGISFVGNVCGQCHSVMAANFEKSPHGRTFPLMGIPGCVACHNNHDIHATSDTMLGLGKAAVCSQCHDAGTPAGDKAAAMRQLIDSLRNELDSAGALLQRAERSGVEVSQAQLDLESAHTALVSSRAAIHTFDLAVLSGEVAGGRKIAAEGLVRGRRALGELRFRRTGLAIFALVVLGLIAALILRIRWLEGPGMRYVMFTLEMKARKERDATQGQSPPKPKH